MASKTVYITTNGCERRSLDASRFANYFGSRGFRMTDSPEKADYIIFVTCSYRKGKEDECLKLIDKFKKFKGELIVAGCFPDIAPSKFKKAFDGKFIETRNIEDAGKLLDDAGEKFRSEPDVNFIHKSVKILPSVGSSAVLKYSSRKELIKFCLRNLRNTMDVGKKTYDSKIKKIAFLRVSNGCVERCSYCCIFRAIGKLKSKPIKDICEEYRKLLDKGHRHFVFIADNLGAYGLDTGSDLGKLIKALSETDKNLKVKWELKELHPRWLLMYKDILAEKVKEGKITTLLCAIQSGNNRILKLMNRHHTIEDVSAALEELRNCNSALQLHTQVIVGFPSETGEELLDTINAIKRIDFNFVQLYPYYDGSDTPASKMDGKHSESEIAVRVKKVIKVLSRNRYFSRVL